MIDRRTAIKSAGAAIGAAWTASSFARIKGANERLNVAVVGVNGRGQAHISAFSKVPNVSVTHIADCDSAVLAKRAAAFAGRGLSTPKTEQDYRRLLDNKDIDIVTVATPDFSHVKVATDAMNAGQHVYCEKPVGLAPAEGEAMIAVQKRTRRHVQIGNQQRSSPETQQLGALIKSGALGTIYEAQAWYGMARKPIGRGQKVAPPASLDWDIWQGPRPRDAYRSNLVHYNWHWVWQYGTGEICNNGMHEIDVARWLMGLQYPQKVTANGSRQFFNNDDWDMYDSMDLRLDYADGRSIRWDGQSGNAMERYGRGRGVLLLGTKGSAVVDRNGYELYDLEGKSTKIVKAAADSETTGTVGEGVLDIYHAGNLVDVIRGKATALNSTIAEGHISTTICHLGNMAYRAKSILDIDPATGRPASAEAMKLWAVDYQPGWEIKV